MHTDLKRIYELNAVFLQVVKHLSWKNQREELAHVLGVEETTAKLLAQASKETLDRVIYGRSNTSFEIQYDEVRLNALLQEQEADEAGPFGNLLSNQSALLEISQSASRTLIHLVFKEMQAWMSYDSTACFRFSSNQPNPSNILKANANTLAKLALDSSTQLKPKFTPAHLEAAEGIQTVPMALLFS